MKCCFGSPLMRLILEQLGGSCTVGCCCDGNLYIESVSHDDLEEYVANLPSDVFWFDDCNE